MEARGDIARFDADRNVERLVNQIENAIDELEQAAFVASLVPHGFAAALIDPLEGLAPRCSSGTEPPPSASPPPPKSRRPSRRCRGRACGGRPAADAEHAPTRSNGSDGAILTGEFDLKTALSAIELSRALERATDRLAAFGHPLREHVLAAPM